MEEFAEIIKSHPGIVLTSENPVTWKGFLVVDPNLGFNVDIKLIVPSYPAVRDATLLFGQSIALLYGTGFDTKIMKLLESTSSVSSLLLQLKRIVMNLIKEKFEDCNRDVGNLQQDIVGELKGALQLDSPVTISATSGLNAVKLSLENVTVTLRKDPIVNNWKLLSSDLPDLSFMDSFESHLGSLSAAMIELQSRVEMLTDTWNQLIDIDNTCWVVDPAQPKPYHLYRRVKLTPSLSALITIDPTRVDVLPDIKLLGSDNEVAKYRNIMCSNYLKWDPDSSIADNLRILMAIDELPQPPEVEEIRKTEAIVEDEECCICFSMELDDVSPLQLPVEICDNEKCKRHFHTVCLVTWLQGIPTNELSFGRIYGTCPNCSESISCTVRTS